MIVVHIWALLLFVVASTEGLVCTPNVCSTVKCADPVGCKGGKTPGFCGCCQQCAKVEGEVCRGPPGTFEGTCDEGLECVVKGSFGHCMPQQY